MKQLKKYWIPCSVLAIFITTELILRLGLGLGNPALIEVDPDTGYRYQPNQKIFRFGKRIEYNQYSQRSQPISLKKSEQTLRILMTGDSILNGGNPIDQSRTITELFQSKLVSSGRSAEVLNASAGSWGIGNVLGYLHEFGTFNSDLVILEIGFHDLIQPKSTSDKVGKDPNFPTHPWLLASQEALVRYLLPKLFRQIPLQPRSEIPISVDPYQQFQKNLNSLKEIIMLIRAQKIPIVVLLVPELSDLLASPSSGAQYKPDFLKVLESLKVPVIDLEAAWSKFSPEMVKLFFRDGIHLTESGNEAIANFLMEKLCTNVQPSTYQSLRGPSVNLQLIACSQ